MRFFALAALVAALFIPAAAAAPGGCCVAPGQYQGHPGVWPPAPTLIDCDSTPEAC